MLLRIYILKDSGTLLQKWACDVQKCKSACHGITAAENFNSDIRKKQILLLYIINIKTLREDKRR